MREDNLDALVLAILCDFKGRDSREVLQDIIHRLIDLTRRDANRMRVGATEETASMCVLRYDGGIRKSSKEVGPKTGFLGCQL